MTFPIEWWQLILIIIVSFSCFMILINVVLKSRRSFEIDAKKGQLKIGEEDEELDKIINPNISSIQKMEEIIKSPLDRTENIKKDFLFVISKSIDFGNEISILRNFDIIKDQMNSAQNKLEKIRNIIINEYQNTFLNENETLDLLNNQHYSMFNFIMKEWLKDTLIEIKRCFRENHLVDYTDESFDEYVNDTSRKIMEACSIYIGERVPNFFGVNRKVILDLYSRKNDKLYEALKNSFYDARKIAMEYNALINKKQKEFEEMIKKITGLKDEVFL